MLMIDLHLFALNCNESFRIVVDEKEKRAKLCCLTLSILVFYVKCFIINLLGPQTRTLTGLSYIPLLFYGCKGSFFPLNAKTFTIKIKRLQDFFLGDRLVDTDIPYIFQ